ncbi:hypothetical protein PM082_013492 [Marasmius tenuissimus]|nr:hypothetical protein PM082_013492 [Marasmius tenuissimus]
MQEGARPGGIGTRRSGAMLPARAKVVVKQFEHGLSVSMLRSYSPSIHLGSRTQDYIQGYSS